MNSNDYQIHFDCGFSILRAAAFNKIDLSKIFSNKSKFLFDYTEIGLEIQKIITYLEKNTGEYIDDIIGLSINLVIPYKLQHCFF
jgi:hypothetical protein